MTGGDLFTALCPVLDRLEALGVPWHIGGSVASSMLGVARATLDVDVVADLPVESARPFVEGLGTGYYADEQAILEAIRRRSCFNLVHLATMVKVDVFLPGDRPFDRAAFARRRRDEWGEGASHRELWVASAEDIVLYKLEWFRQGGEVSDRQYQDVVGVLRVQGPRLDEVWLATWAAALGVSDLLERALRDAGRGGRPR